MLAGPTATDGDTDADAGADGVCAELADPDAAAVTGLAGEVTLGRVVAPAPPAFWPGLLARARYEPPPMRMTRTAATGRRT
jgi:hypothetical protein